MKKIKNEKSEKKHTCSVCGKSYLERARKFTPSHSPIYKGNSGLLTICRDCVSNIYEKYLKKLNGDEYNAIKETEYIMQSPATMEAIRRAADELDRGETVRQEDGETVEDFLARI